MYSLSDILEESIPDLKSKRLRPVKAAILDTGVDATHEVLRGKVDGAWEFKNDHRDEHGNILPIKLSPDNNNDGSEHGTAVASIVSRIAPNARLLDYKVMTGSWTGENVVAGLRAAIDGDARIINMSLNCPKSYKHELEDLLEEAYQKHKIVIASRRNENHDDMAGVKSFDDVGFPAELVACIGVGSRMNNVKGRGADNPYMIELIDRPPLGMAADGEGILVAKSGGGYQRLTGASYASPIVAGVVAMLLGRYPDLELFEIKSIIKYHFQKGSYKKLDFINPLEVAPSMKRDSSPLAGLHICPVCSRSVTVNEAFSFGKCPACGHVFPLLADLERRIYDEVTEKLASFVPNTCHYHDVRHTREVVANVNAFMRRYPTLSAVSRKCLMTAALLHDYGYIESYEANEPLAAQFAADYLPQHGYSEQETSLIQSLILATTIPVSPKNLLEKILCDADVGHIGLERYWERTVLLRREREEHGVFLTEAEWLKGEIAFLSKQHFFQPWLEKERKEARTQAVETMSRKLRKLTGK